MSTQNNEMKFTLYVSEEDKSKLEYEVASYDLRVHLTRVLDTQIDEGRIHNLNRIVNASRRLVGLPPYVLESDQWGEYHAAEYSWHEGELQMAFMRLDAVQFVEYVCELIDKEWLGRRSVNELLADDGRSFQVASNRGSIKAEVLSIVELEASEGDQPGQHPNIRVLVERMDRCLEDEDVSGVLHASASIFETMAKDVVAIQSVQDNTLGSFFQRYRKDSLLPEELLDMIIETYNNRNTEPLAGHGSTQNPELSKEEAVALNAMTKAFVRIEYQLHAEQARAPGNQGGT